MITLYELHWSHYCEKIRLALAPAGLPWQTCDIHAFSKKELLVFPLPLHMSKRTVPAIFDAAHGELVMDSTPILRYLCKHYPQVQALYPGGISNQQAIDAMLIELDTKLGLLARRFGYTQVILECPSLLSILFLSRAAGGFFTLPGVRWIAPVDHPDPHVLRVDRQHPIARVRVVGSKITHDSRGLSLNAGHRKDVNVTLGSRLRDRKDVAEARGVRVRRPSVGHKRNRDSRHRWVNP